jgi:hypothetical protein
MIMKKAALFLTALLIVTIGTAGNVHGEIQGNLKDCAERCNGEAVCNNCCAQRVSAQMNHCSSFCDDAHEKCVGQKTTRECNSELLQCRNQCADTIKFDISCPK